MIGNENRSRVATQDRAHQVQEQRGSLTTTPGDAPYFAAVYVARRYGLPMPIATVVARLASLGRAIG